MLGLSLTRTIRRLEACLVACTEMVASLEFNMDNGSEVSVVKGTVIIPDDANQPAKMFRIDAQFEKKIGYQKFMQAVDEFMVDFCDKMDTEGEYACCRFTDLDEEKDMEESNG